MFRPLSAFGVALLLVSPGAVLSGCSSPATSPNTDAGARDAGASDAGSVDAGNTPDAGPVDSSAEQTALTTLATAMKNFHKDTGGWPWGGAVWIGVNSSRENDVQLEPGAYTDNDTALFSSATLDTKALPACSAGSKPCWGGPYMMGVGPAMGSMSEFDSWGHKRLFAYIRPHDGNGGGTLGNPNGSIIVWSAGPDGLDQTGCSTTDVMSTQPACSLDYDKLVAGKMSASTGDDVIVLVASDVK
jgi:hypothetical protein